MLPFRRRFQHSTGVYTAPKERLPGSARLALQPTAMRRRPAHISPDGGRLAQRSAHQKQAQRRRPFLMFRRTIAHPRRCTSSRRLAFRPNREQTPPSSKRHPPRLGSMATACNVDYSVGSICCAAGCNFSRPRRLPSNWGSCRRTPPLLQCSVVEISHQPRESWTKPKSRWLLSPKAISITTFEGGMQPPLMTRA